MSAHPADTDAVIAAAFDWRDSLIPATSTATHPAVRRLLEALERYECEHPRAQRVYRHDAYDVECGRCGAQLRPDGYVPQRIPDETFASTTAPGPWRTTMADHEHDYGLDARHVPIGTARMCRSAQCTEWGVRHRGHVRWEPPTVDETIALVEHMMWATAVAQAFTIIHGRERGLQRAREVLGYG